MSPSESKSCERVLRRVDHGEVSGLLDQLNYQLQGKGGWFGGTVGQTWSRKYHCETNN